MHPTTGEPGLLVVQQDTSAWAQMEALLADLVETQLNTAANLFPRRIVEYLSTNKSVSAPQQMAQLARQHQDVTLLFMEALQYSQPITTARRYAFLRQAVVLLLFTAAAAHRWLHSPQQGGSPRGGHGVLKHPVRSVRLPLRDEGGDGWRLLHRGWRHPGLAQQQEWTMQPAQGVQDDGFTEVLQEHDPVDSASRVMAFAKDMMAASKTVMTPHNNQPVVIRIGMHTGNCVSGLIGQKIPKFAVFGDTMNVASRMESTCIPGRIQLSAATARLLPHEPLHSTGGIQVKGQGMMQTYFLGEPALETLTAEHIPPGAVKSAATPATFSTAGSMLADGGDDRPTSLRLLNSAMHAANCLSNGSMRRKGVPRASLDWGPQAGPHTSRPTPMRLSQVSLLLPDSGSATPGGGNQPRGSHCLGSPNLSRASCALAAEKGITVAISQPLQKLRFGRQEDAIAPEHLQALQNKATIAGTRAPAASRLATKTGAAAARWRTAVAELASAAAGRSTAPELVLPPQLVSPALPLPVWALDAPLPSSGPLPPHASALLPGPTPHLSPAEHVFGETSLQPPLTVDSSSPAVEAKVHATPTSSQLASPLEAQHSAPHSTALVSMMPTPKVCRELTAVPCPDPTKSVTATSATPQPADCQPVTAAAPSLAPR
ncbi:guanylate cyclase domain-containing protein, partial [Haematococcus lacustris]